MLRSNQRVLRRVSGKGAALKSNASGSGLQNEAPRARAVRALRGWIADGVLRAGEVLPAERELSVKLGVGLGTVQRAIRMMENEGLIIRRAGRTRMVAAPAERSEGVLADSVVVIADAVDMRPGQRIYGWGGYVGAGALHGLNEDTLHAMLVSPQHLDEEALSRLLAGGPRGLIIPEIDVPNVNIQRWLELASESKTPTVVFGDEPGSELFDRVVPDHATGAYELTKWLIQLGRRAIRQYWTNAVPTRWMQARREGYERAMREAGLTPLESISRSRGAYTGLDFAGEFAAEAQAAAGALIPCTIGGMPTDALMVDTDGNIAMVACALAMLNKVPNKDVVLVVYDEYWDQAPSNDFNATPPLASVNKNNFECGRALSMLLHERLDGKLPPEPQVRLIKPALVVRDAESSRSAV
jgi:DNA-binding LacI/PurR family transcriptional regulator